MLMNIQWKKKTNKIAYEDKYKKKLVDILIIYYCLPWNNNNNGIVTQELQKFSSMIA